MQTSASTLFGYAGNVFIVALALSAAGIGLERVAWIASALSVGIGFGLQAVVQNFVSGLILLAERPVKVGDWVSLSDIEGDIRRINVRATEIQMWDRSTVVVPNSEFITKIVRNVTHANPLGRVQVRLSMPVATDAEQARGLMLDALASHAGVLDEPAPSVLLDGIDTSGLRFIATGYVASPRLASGIRSDVLFDVLKRLREAGLALSSPTTIQLAEMPRLAPPSIAAVAPQGSE
jgi:small-conductance mechanosensitive channel